jgi:hypothetical protein
MIRILYVEQTWLYVCLPFKATNSYKMVMRFYYFNASLAFFLGSLGSFVSSTFCVVSVLFWCESMIENAIKMWINDEKIDHTLEHDWEEHIIIT